MSRAPASRHARHSVKVHGVCTLCRAKAGARNCHRRSHGTGGRRDAGNVWCRSSYLETVRVTGHAANRHQHVTGRGTSGDGHVNGSRTPTRGSSSRPIKCDRACALRRTEVGSCNCYRRAHYASAGCQAVDAGVRRCNHEKDAVAVPATYRDKKISGRRTCWNRDRNRSVSRTCRTCVNLRIKDYLRRLSTVCREIASGDSYGCADLR